MARVARQRGSTAATFDECRLSVPTESEGQGRHCPQRPCTQVSGGSDKRCNCQVKILTDTVPALSMFAEKDLKASETLKCVLKSYKRPHDRSSTGSDT